MMNKKLKTERGEIDMKNLHPIYDDPNWEAKEEASYKDEPIKEEADIAYCGDLSPDILELITNAKGRE